MRELRAELRKLALPEIVLAALVAAGIAALVPVLVGLANLDGPSMADRIAMARTFLLVVAAAVGILAGTSEYPAQMSTTLRAVPRRGRLVAAKIVAVTLVLTGVAAVCAACCLVALRRDGPPGDDVPRVLIASAIGMIALGHVGHGVGLALRGVAAPTVLVLVLLVIAPVVLHPFPWSRVLPDHAAAALATSTSATAPSAPAAMLSPTGGLVALLVWAAAATLWGAWVAVRRDA